MRAKFKSKYEFHSRVKRAVEEEETPYLRGWRYCNDNTLSLDKPVDRDVELEEDQFTEELGPLEIADIRTVSAALYFESGGTELRELAIQKVKEKELRGEDGKLLNWAEFGTERGLSAYFFSHFLHDGRQFYLFDSWQGLPEPWVLRRKNNLHGKKLEGGLPKGAFASVKPVFHRDDMIMVEGWFKDTLPKPDMGDLSFVHVDCDLYSSTKTVLQRCNEQIVPGTIILFDELWGYECWREGEYKALMEWDREWKYLARDKDYRALIEVVK
jgi:hypothetical protein